MICKCGHLREEHTKEYAFCKIVKRENGILDSRHCIQFQYDNLAYLEYLYNQRKEVANGKK